MVNKILKIAYSGFFIYIGIMMLVNEYEITNQVSGKLKNFGNQIGNEKLFDLNNYLENKILFVYLASLICIGLSILAFLGFNSFYSILAILYFSSDFILNNYLNLKDETSLKEFENLIISFGILIFGFLISFKNNQIIEQNPISEKENNLLKTSCKKINNLD